MNQSPSKKKIAVIGAAGFIGSAFVAHAKQAGHEVVAITKTDADLLEPASANILATKLAACDAVLVLSALTPKKGLTALQNTTRLMDNLRIAENVCKAIAATSVPRIIYLSTDAVYAPQLATLHETSETEPACLYGLAHKVRERMFAEICQDRQLCIIRPCALYGANDPHNGYGPNRFLREAIAKHTITLFGRGEEVRNHMLVNDFVRVMLQMLMRVDLCGIYNVAPKDPISFFELAELLVRTLPFAVTLNFVARAVPLQHKVHSTIKLDSVMPNLHYTPLVSGVELMYKCLVSETDSEREVL